MAALLEFLKSLFPITSFFKPISLFGNARPDLSIEGMRSYEFSVGIFIFLIICILVFTYIVFRFMNTGPNQGLKRGEKIMFAWIFLGIVVAIVMGAVQMLLGNLL